MEIKLLENFDVDFHYPKTLDLSREDRFSKVSSNFINEILKEIHNRNNNRVNVFQSKENIGRIIYCFGY